MENMQDILLYALGILLAVVGFMMKQLWSDIRESKEENGKLKGRMELAEQKFDQALDKISHVNNLKIQQLTEKFDIFASDMKDHINMLTEQISCMSQRPDRDINGRFTKRK
tara:strand:+ start:92 stop:424 length:333 start_codon:yes stop_codon:yes gene_type:complete